MKLRIFTQHAPEHDLPIMADHRFLAQAAAAATTEQAVLSAHSALTLYGVKLTFDAAVVGANTNSFTVTLNQYRAGALVGALAAVPFVAGTNATKFVALDMGTRVLTLAKGDVLTVAFAQVGTGLACPAGRVEVNYGVAGPLH